MAEAPAFGNSMELGCAQLVAAGEALAQHEAVAGDSRIAPVSLEKASQLCSALQRTMERFLKIGRTQQMV